MTPALIHPTDPTNGPESRSGSAHLAPDRAAQNHAAQPGWRAMVITVSDRCSAGQAVDRSGPTAVAALNELGWKTDAAIVPDGQPVAVALRAAIDADYELVLTSGGTGIAPRDLTPEMTGPLLERELPGIPELLRRDGYPMATGAILSRALAGVTGTTLIINLAGSPGAVRDAMRVLPPVINHAVRHIHGDTVH